MPTEATHSSNMAVAVDGLTRRYVAFTAVDAVTFTVGRGEVFGFLGPNGAGKTTTIRMLVGLVRPSAGTVVINGHDLAREREAALRALGCIVESPDFYDYLSGRENLEHFARMVGPEAFARIDSVARLLRIDARLGDRVGT